VTSDAEILKTLARTLEVEKTIHQHGIHEAELREILLRASSLLEAEERPSGGGQELTIYTDGASRGNPGPAGAGFIIYDGPRPLEGQAQYLGRLTNNQAEYNAVILALQRARQLGAKKVKLKTDSELLAKQLKGVYRVKNKMLAGLYSRVKELIRDFDSFSVEHVYREENQEADLLANRAIDEFEKED